MNFASDWIHTKGIGIIVYIIGIVLAGLILSYDYIMGRDFSIGWMAIIGLVVAMWLVYIGRGHVVFWNRK